MIRSGVCFNSLLKNCIIEALKKGLLLKAIYILNNNITWIIARLKVPWELTPYKDMLPETTVETKEINVMLYSSNAITGLLSVSH